MTDLLTRLRSAEKGSRELDVELARFALGYQEVKLALAGRVGYQFTTSIDAIVSLIEKRLPEWEWLCRSSGYAEVRHPTSNRKDESARANTPPLALCIAFLLALEHQS